LYYSGHGITDDYGELYFAVKNTDMELFASTAVEAAFVRRQLDSCMSQRKVVILDCCHSGAFASGTRSVLGSAIDTRAVFEGAGYGRVILTASNSIQYAWEGGEILGEAEEAVFTHFIVKGLQTGEADLKGDDKISLDELYNYTYEKVVSSGAKQTPQKFIDRAEGEIIIALSPRQAAKLAEEPKPEPVPELHPSLALRLSVKPQKVEIGEETKWTVTLRNDGKDDLRRVSVRHGLTLLDKPFELIMGKGRRFAFVKTYETKGTKSEKVTVAGIASDGSAVRDEASATVQVSPKPTPEVLNITSPVHLELIRIPAGAFYMGSDPERDNYGMVYEQPQHRVYVSEFYIGKYPITNEQYAAFVQATSYEPPEHWSEGKMPSGKEDHPVIEVSWEDAVKFCQWLEQETGKPYRLPTEAEWEKAARGTDSRIYPWDDDIWDETKCNTSENGVRVMTPVGQFSPQGDSPYGVSDMAGNVWEWCADWYDAEEYKSRAGKLVKDPQGPESGPHHRVVRGGSFFSNPMSARCAFRRWHYPFIPLRYLGFRVVVSS
jgi:formylglycine-generating enzyme required for sulfatase activity